MADQREPDPSTSHDGSDSVGRLDVPPAGDGSADAVEHDEDPVVEPSDTAESTASESGDPGRTWYGRRRRKPRKPRRKAPWWELPALVLLAVGIAILVKSFVVQPFYIPSESMEKTLHGCTGCHGDRILVNKPIFDLRDPHPGDIVVFHDPKDWNSDEPATKPPSNPIVRTVRGFGQLVGFVPPDGQVLVKRVIATGGQTVRGVEVKGSHGLTIDRIDISTSGPSGPWRSLNEPYTYRDVVHGNEMSFGPVTVPKGRLWVMGDHRNDSSDSRYHCSVGGQGDDLDCDAVSSTVPVSDVIGKAFVIAWPPSRWRTLGTPATFTNAAQAAGTALPGVASLATVVPVFLIRRRRRAQ